MIDFACRKISKSDLMKCAFSLNKTELRLFVSLLGVKQGITASELAEKEGIDRTTAQKALKSLVSKKLVLRFQKNLPRGSYTFVYRSIKKSELKEEINSNLSNWLVAVEKEIDRI